MSVENGTGNTAPVLTTVTVLTFLWALFSYVVRTIVKIKLGKTDTWGADDFAITAAMVWNPERGQRVPQSSSLVSYVGRSVGTDDLHLLLSQSRVW